MSCLIKTFKYTNNWNEQQTWSSFTATYWTMVVHNKFIILLITVGLYFVLYMSTIVTMLDANNSTNLSFLFMIVFNKTTTTIENGLVCSSLYIYNAASLCFDTQNS